MAIAINTETVGKRKVTLNGTVTAFSLLAHNGTNWVDADASDKTLPAQLLALQDGDSGDVVEAAPYVVLYDADAPYTQNALQYLSETAGVVTETRPTTIGALRQRVGHAVSTDTVVFDIGFAEQTVPITLQFATSAAALLDSGQFGAAGTLDAQNEVAVLSAQLPENFLSVTKAGLVIAAEATAGTPTMDILISGALSDEAWDANTVDNTLADQVREGSAADDVFELVITTGFTSTNGLALSKPGSPIGIKCTQDDSGTDVSMVVGGYITCKVTK